jgi:hypothetical protein
MASTVTAVAGVLQEWSTGRSEARRKRGSASAPPTEVHVAPVLRMVREKKKEAYVMLVR